MSAKKLLAAKHEQLKKSRPAPAKRGKPLGTGACYGCRQPADPAFAVVRGPVVRNQCESCWANWISRASGLSRALSTHRGIL